MTAAAAVKGISLASANREARIHFDGGFAARFMAETVKRERCAKQSIHAMPPALGVSRLKDIVEWEGWGRCEGMREGKA